MHEHELVPSEYACACVQSHSVQKRDSSRMNIDAAFIPCVRGPHTLACSFLAVASFWRCPAYPEHPWDQAELALCRLRSNEAFHRRADRCLRDWIPFPFSRERALQSASSPYQADSTIEKP